ncbi:MAG: energy-coupling factor transporter transmembrane protein EcfT [Treponema sp.]|jgi:energy-coupling factor transport system permease protein|nr:energy-coupling factor transporter transmembrane protein EcfT [Treponema sp.]
MTGLLDYVPGHSMLHRSNPCTKLILALMLCAACFITEHILIVAGIIALNVAVAFGAGVGIRSLKILASLIKLSIVLFIVQILFVREGKSILTLPFNINITDRGLLFSLLFVLRIMAAALPLTLVLSVTKISAIAQSLVQYVNIPYKYTFVLTTAIRFIPLFAQEMTHIMEAQMARGVAFDTKNFFKKIRLILPLCVPLLIVSVRKIESGAISAELRGFNLRNRASMYRRYRFSLSDLIIFLGGISVVIISALSRFL